MNRQSSLVQAITFLRQDLLRNIVPLKMLATHPDAIDIHYAQYNEDAGIAFTLYRNDAPVAACFTYQNFETIHEIGGVVTLPSERRKGYAKQIVETAVAALQRRGCMPRYQVHEANIPSIRLAEQMGLVPFVVTEHWRYRPASQVSSTQHPK